MLHISYPMYCLAFPMFATVETILLALGCALLCRAYARERGTYED